MCSQCQHCHDKMFKCNRCGVNVTVKNYQNPISRPMNVVELHPDSISDHINEKMTFYLCNKCVDRLYNFMGFKLYENDMGIVVDDSFGNRLV